MPTKIGTLISNVQAELLRHKYAPSTRLSFGRALSTIEKWFQESAKGFYSVEAHAKYLKYLDSCSQSSGSDSVWLKYKRRCIGWIGDCATNGEISITYERCGQKQFVPSAAALALITEIIQHSHHKGSTDRHADGLLRKFFCFVEDNGENVHGISRATMVEFLRHCAGIIEMSHVTTSLRIAAEYFVSTGAMSSVPDFRFIVPKIRRKKIIPAFTEDEIVALLNTIDRDTPLGKRNFAIVFLAVSTGIRAGDVVNLKLTDVDYVAKTITIVQGKTQKPLVTPISGQLCNIIADYVLNGRPQTADTHIFIRHCAPFVAFRVGSPLGTMLDRLCLKAGVKMLPGRGFHSLRRTFGTWLAKSEISVRLISQLFGHVNLDSGKPYYSFKDEELFECAMDFADIPIVGRIFHKNDRPT